MSDASDEVVQRLLAYETWAVVGLGNPARPAYGVAELLLRKGKRVVPIHPWMTDVLGQPTYTSLLDVPHPVDVVDVFRRSDEAGRFADEAVTIGAKGVWFQLGIVDQDAFARTTAAGLDMVMNRCPAIEFRGS